jgi:hypothetical protein
MADPTADTINSFEDLEHVSPEVLRQVAMRVHIVELAYAFSAANEVLRDRLFDSVRPGLAEEIRSAMRTVDTADARYAPEPQIRSAQAKVLDIARLVLSTSSGES